MKKSERPTRASYLRWTLAGGLLLIAGIFLLSFDDTKSIGFILLGASFILNLIGVLKAPTQIKGKK